jgi:2-dehydropantoate 2-reductase
MLSSGCDAHAASPPLFDRAAEDSFSTMLTEPILVAGAGAIGSIIGAMLHRARHRVTLLGRKAHMDAIARDGLRISGLLGEHTISGVDTASDPTALRGSYAVILCTVKSYDTAAIADAIATRLAEGGVVVSLQNGLGNLETLAERFSLARVLGGRVIFGAEVPRPGHAHVTVFADPVAIGPAPSLHGGLSAGLEARARELAAIIDAAGVPTVACADIIPVIWAKLLYNVALNPLGALLGLHYGALADDPDLRAIMDAVIHEAFAVAHRLGVALPFADAAAYLTLFYGKLVPVTYSHRPTMLLDLTERGRTDIDALNGKIVELAEKLGLDAPTNRMLVRMVHGAERKRSRELGEAS